MLVPDIYLLPAGAGDWSNKVLGLYKETGETFAYPFWSSLSYLGTYTHFIVSPPTKIARIILAVVLVADRPVESPVGRQWEPPSYLCLQMGSVD